MAIGCTRGRKRNQLMCRTCWNLVPKDIQQRVYRTYEEKLEHNAAFHAPHSDAVMAAIRAAKRA